MIVFFLLFSLSKSTTEFFLHAHHALVLFLFYPLYYQDSFPATDAQDEHMMDYHNGAKPVMLSGLVRCESPKIRDGRYRAVRLLALFHNFPYSFSSQWTNEWHLSNSSNSSFFGLFPRIFQRVKMVLLCLAYKKRSILMLLRQGDKNACYL